MRLHHHAMQAEDIPECVDVVAAHPVIGPRYGQVTQDLPEAWRRLLNCRACVAHVFRDGSGLRAPIYCVGVSVFVRDEFIQELKSPPHFWIGPELTRRIVRDESPLLTPQELRRANSRGGLNLLTWECCYTPAYDGCGEVHRYMMAEFVQRHRGYLWKELISAQSTSPEYLFFVLKTGAYLWDPIASSYTSVVTRDPCEIVSQPHVTGITRELQQGLGGTWVGALFDYHPPALGFSEREQSLLSCALSGATDEQLAGMLGISVPVVKKMWVSIYRRVEDRIPELLPNPLELDGEASKRGREKRRGLLAYLRGHMEELRPYSRKMLGSAVKGSRIGDRSRQPV